MKKLLLIISISLMLIVSCAKANKPYSTDGKLRLVTTYPVVGDPVDIDVSADCVFVAEDLIGFSILNRHDASLYMRLSEINSIQLRKVPLIRYNHNHKVLFVVDQTISSLHQIYAIKFDSPSTDIADYNIRNFVGQTLWVRDFAFEDIPGENNKFDMYITNFSANENRIQKGIYDLSLSHNNLQLLHFRVMPNAVHSIKLTDNHIIKAMGQRGVYISEKTNQLTFTSVVDTPGDARDVLVNGNIVYVADRQQGLQVVDITNINNPVLLDTAKSTDGYAVSLSKSGNLLAVGSGSGGVYLYDISTPANPILIDRLRYSDIGYVNKVLFYDNELYVASRDSGILRYQIQ